MKITVLVDDLTKDCKFDKKHGLSFYIESKNKKILFDLGPNDTFIKNAKKMNIDLNDVDIVIISHGHRDHGGGLEDFLKINSKAKIYINRFAFNDYYTDILKKIKHNISLNKKFKWHERVILINGLYKVDNDIYLYNKIRGKELIPSTNNNLYRKRKEKYVADNFQHEQNLLINEDSKHYVFVGCGHRGIINILNEGEKVAKDNIDYLFGGFHLYDYRNKKYESDEFINSISKRLNEKTTICYCCHCTGEEAYKKIKNIVKDKINYIKAGDVVEK